MMASCASSSPDRGDQCLPTTTSSVERGLSRLEMGEGSCSSIMSSSSPSPEKFSFSQECSLVEVAG